MDFGSSVIEAINDSKLENIKVKRFGYNDCFVKQGSVEELENEYGLDKNRILKELLNNSNKDKNVL